MVRKLDLIEELDDAIADMGRLGAEFPEDEIKTGRNDEPRRKPDSVTPKPFRPEQSRILQLTALVTAVGAIVTSLVVALKPDNSKDQEAYEKSVALYDIFRRDAIRQNNDQAVTRTEVGRLADEKNLELELMRRELDELRRKVRLPTETAPPPMPLTPKLPPIAPVVLPRSLDDLPPAPKR